jgi:hypothetical protein
LQRDRPERYGDKAAGLPAFYVIAKKAAQIVNSQISK